LLPTATLLKRALRARILLECPQQKPTLCESDALHRDDRLNNFAVAVGIGVAGVLLIDSVGAWASRVLGFRYTILLYPQIAVWAAAGSLAAFGVANIVRAMSLAVAAGAVVGLVDATIGWWISAKIGPGRPRLPDGTEPSQAQIAQMASGAVMFAILTAAVGGALSLVLSAIA
jgi:hypothetical protein